MTEFTLANGMQFLVVERHQAPVVSFNTLVNAGSMNDPTGRTGLAHMFEHMAFKGTQSIGTQNWSEEQKALNAVNSAYDALDREKRKGIKASADRIQSLNTELRVAIDRANLYVIPNEFARIVEENGGVGMNASTALEVTSYTYSLPSNRLELWFLLESERFKRPVFREFYKERDVVREERRQRVESSPQGKLQEAFLTTAFAAHPYRQTPGGWPSDIENLSVQDAEAFFQDYYSPGNLTVCIAGDVNPADAKRLAEKYFGPIPARSLPPAVRTSEPPQEGAKRVELEFASQPLVMIGYKRPDGTHADDLVFDMISLILSSGRTGILYRDLIRDRKIAVAAPNVPTFPGGRFPNLFTTILVPAPGRTIEENEKAYSEALEQLKKTPVDDSTLRRVRAKARAGLLRRLDSNSGLANLLPIFQVNYGNWRRLFTSLDDLDKVTAGDIRRVAAQYFVERNKTVATVGNQGGAN